MLGLKAQPLEDGSSGFAAAFERRLDGASSAPLAVGVSGGGDSLALLMIALDWARVHRRRVLALSVDHRLQPDSAAWTAQALGAATRAGAEPHALEWNGPKPVTGLPAAARDARHRLLADASRALGARVLLLGHTADDLEEAAAMRAQGASVGSPREWSPSPVWPQGRGVFLLRPLLGTRREALRNFLRDRGERWFDDPANDDLKFARARARSLISAEKGRIDEGPDGWGGTRTIKPAQPPRVRPVGFASGGVALPRGGLTSQRLAAACLCVAGHDRQPRRDRVEALALRMAAPGRVAATLAGARIEADESAVRFAREIGRQDLPVLCLPPGEPAIWDGRYEITAAAPGLRVRALAGLAARLPRAERLALARIPAFARPALPVIVNADGAVSCPILAGEKTVRIEPLVLSRLEAACGFVTQE